jgi:hypothetical protein
MDSEGNVETGTEAQREQAALARRRLLKAALGTGAAVAAYTAPQISVVPAYGLTSSNRFNNRCYGLGWSSNNPTGKGWMSQTVQAGLFSGVVSGPATGPGANVGNGTATYTWSLGPFDSVPAFTLTVRASGCVNTGGGRWVVSGMPTGYCLKFYNNGRPFTSASGTVSLCTRTTPLTTAPNSQASPTSVGNGGTVTFGSQGLGSCTGSGQGIIRWMFDIGPC